MPPQAFDATLGLGAVRADPADARLGQGTTDLGPRGAPGELVGKRDRSLAGMHEDGVAIGVDLDRQAIALHGAGQDGEVAGGVLLGPEGARGDQAGGVVDGAHQGQEGSARAQPAMPAAVDLEESASLGHALPAAAVAGSPSPSGGRQAGLGQQATERALRDGQPFPFSQQVSEVGPADPGVGARGQLEHPLTHSLVGAVDR